MAPRGEDEYLQWLHDQVRRLRIEGAFLVAEFSREYRYPLKQFQTWQDVIAVIRELELELMDDQTAKGWLRKRFLYLVAKENDFQIDVDSTFQPFEMFQLSDISAIEVDGPPASPTSLSLNTPETRWFLSFTRKFPGQRLSPLLEINLPRVGYLNCFQTAYVGQLQVAETGTSIVFTVPETTEWQAEPLDIKYGPYYRIAVTGTFSSTQRGVIKDALVSLTEGLRLEWRTVGAT